MLTCCLSAADCEKTAVSHSSIASVSTVCGCMFLQVMEAVETAFVERFGPYAGWAHNTLFIAELASQQVPLDAVHTLRNSGFAGWA